MPNTLRGLTQAVAVLVIAAATVIAIMFAVMMLLDVIEIPGLEPVSRIDVVVCGKIVVVENVGPSTVFVESVYGEDGEGNSEELTVNAQIGPGETFTLNFTSITPEVVYVEGRGFEGVAARQSC